MLSLTVHIVFRRNGSGTMEKHPNLPAQLKQNFILANWLVLNNNIIVNSSISIYLVCSFIKLSRHTLLFANTEQC